jgi:hypothetical protein
LEGRVLHYVRRDVGDRVPLQSPNVRAITIERKLPVRCPVRDDASWTLRTCRAGEAEFTCASQRYGPWFTRRSAYISRPCDAGTACGTGRAGRPTCTSCERA